MRSRERAAALKREGYCCEVCGVKQSKAKGREITVCVHHIKGIKWEKVIDYIIDEVLQTPEDLMVCCNACHKAIHDKEKENK